MIQGTIRLVARGIRWIGTHPVRAGLVAIGTALCGYVAAVVIEALPSVSESYCYSRELFTNYWPLGRSEPSPSKFRILVAALDLDDVDRSQTKAVIRKFQGHNAIEVVETCRVLKIIGAGADADAQASEEGQWLLRLHRADILVFGEVLEKDKALNLHFLSNGGPIDSKVRSFQLSRGVIENDFSGAAALQLQAVALAAVKPVTEQRGTLLAEALRPVIDKIKALIQAPPPELSGADMSGIHLALGTAQWAVGEQAGDNAVLQDAVGTFTDILKEQPLERTLLVRAIIQNDLCATLQYLGAMEGNIPRLITAVEICTQARDEFYRDHAPTNWALAEISLGTAHESIGQQRGDIAELQAAVDAFNDAKKELPPDRVPLEWAVNQNDLCWALKSLGELESGTQDLEAGVEACGDALDKIVRDHAPLYWALLQNNLGNVLEKLGERTSGNENLEKAVDAENKALEILTPEQVPFRWALVQNDLGTALRTLGAREAGTRNLNRAIEAFTNALTKLTQAGTPRYWAMAQYNLGIAFYTIGAREQGTEHLKDSLGAFDKALKVRTPDGMPLDWADTQNGIGIANEALAQRESPLEHLQAAITAYSQACSVFLSRGARYYVEACRRNLERANESLNSMQN